MSNLKDVKEVEVFHAGNVSVDELPWIPYFGDAKFKLLKANPVTGQTVTLLSVPAKMQLPAHFHPGTVIVYTVQGTWRYLEEPWISKPGDMVYEPAGSKHTPIAVGDEDVITFNIVEGTLDYLGEEGEIVARDNWETFLRRYYEHCAAEAIEPIDVTKF
ncbi:cupin [Bacillus sp. Soil745]|uniref:2,4'-dihydroxyacetophenone dioxygenase family protein n=1 Tax=Peribacillus frigoritolerans TaxID=450367 RepID=UPI00070D618A|nr:2,4'-dihydroxyacetophenone dioxygenase family protein [Peribacillus frigoritolerans]KRF59763.1 cupin [Bacillus sp. Soil745]PAW27604.1 cupin [Peribacillus simplex]MED3711522.1 2,4'-dihydroxyacetophenone dioxygenase family protein [Peribacillus frigoritolerans]MED3785985.1 2,4'-dihydroxyacetophenone dioxygenase family protein [Peribacillus frigoritolerans]MED3892209.1 2,4'-dihydroxyacetophenone dioxygenase family protein [Peribacillus frigoritolerans]